MPRNVILDSSALVALLDPRDQQHAWAKQASADLPFPWLTCEAVLVESFFLLPSTSTKLLDRILGDGRLRIAFILRDDIPGVLDLKNKYSNVPMSLADACLVRMTETLSDPLLMTTDVDFKIYRRHSRQVVPCLMP